MRPLLRLRLRPFQRRPQPILGRGLRRLAIILKPLLITLATLSESRRSTYRHRGRLHQDNRGFRVPYHLPLLRQFDPCRLFRRRWCRPIPHGAAARRMTSIISSPAACPNLHAEALRSMHLIPRLRVPRGSMRRPSRRFSRSRSSRRHRRRSLPWPTLFSTPASA